MLDEYSSKNDSSSHKDKVAERSEALVCEAKGPGIDSRCRRWCFFRKMVIARKVAEKEERGKRQEREEKRAKRKEQRKKKTFFLIF